MRISILRPLVLALLYLLPSGFGNAASHALELLPHWKQGDSINLTITRTREKSVDDQSRLSGKTHTPISIEVLQANHAGYVVGWTAGDTTFEEPAPSDSFLRHLVGLMRGVQIVLQINPQGTIIGVQNWKELRGNMVHAMDTLLANPSDSQNGPTDQLLRSKLRTQWGTMFSTKAKIEEICTRDAHVYFMAMGKRYTLNKPSAYHGQFANPLGGDPFPTHGQISLQTFDQQSGEAMLTWNHTTDPTQTARILDTMIKGLTSRRGKAAPPETFAKTMTMTDNTDIVVDTRTGWVRKLTRTQSTQLGTRTQIDKTIIVKSAH